MKKMLGEFKDFINKGNLVQIAIGLLMALAFAPVVAAFTEGIVMQLIAAIVGQPDFSSVGLDIGDSRLLIGDFINAAINFVAVAAVCFFIVKGYDSWRKKDEEAAGPTEVELLTEIRDALRNR